MIVPEYWAEAKGICAVNNRKVSVKRFGWSDNSVDEAQRHANIRLADAIRLMESGVTTIAKREPKTAYNGAEGVPIREEIISRHDDVLITRNGYGARCLNTPDVLFADIDVPIGPSIILRSTCIFLSLLSVAIVAWLTNSWNAFILMAFASLFAGMILANVIDRLIAVADKKNSRALTKVRRFSESHPQWHLRIYKTPMGFRILVMHGVFDPRSDEVKKFFHALAVDSLYQKMCFHQRCFRARVSPKPWRIGISEHLRPRPGVWPVNEEKLPVRHAWVDNYESRAHGYASCHFVTAMGEAHIHAKALSVQKLHDELSRALTDLPIA